jgi:hypothetical protein
LTSAGIFVNDQLDADQHVEFNDELDTEEKPALHPFVWKIQFKWLKNY